MTESRYPLTPEQHRALITETSIVDAALGADFEIACNLNAADHLHVRRLGLPQESHARVGVMVHSGPSHGIVFIHPAEARALAASLLNTADEIEGRTPLVFFPRPLDEGSLDDPKVQP